MTSSTRLASRPCECASQSRWLRADRLGCSAPASSSDPITRIGCRRLAYDVPPTVAVPSSAASRPRMTRIVVDLPAPFGPTKPVTWPGWTVNDMPSSARVGPNRFRSPDTSIVACISRFFPYVVGVEFAVTWFYGKRHNMGRTQAVIPLLGPARHAEVGWQSRSPDQGVIDDQGITDGIADRRERHMRAQRLPVLPTMLRLPGRTVRVRLTAMYGILFLVSGAVLLAIASGVAVARSASVQAAPAPNQARPGSALAQGSALARAQARIQALQAQVQNLQSQNASPPGQDRLSHQLLIASLIALAIMTVISVALGWLVAGRGARPGPR